MFQRTGVKRDRITIYTGVGNAEKLGIVSRWNGQDRMDYWGGEECNRIDGTDGSFYPPHLVNRQSRLYIYHHDMCRRMPLEYKEDVIVSIVLIFESYKAEVSNRMNYRQCKTQENSQ